MYITLILILATILVLILIFLLFIKLRDFDFKFNVFKDNQERVEKIIKEQILQNRAELVNNIKDVREEIDTKLEKIRQTVGETLSTNLEKQFGISFKVVSERLEQVHKSLGEMQMLASTVGDLKKVLSNVKTTGIWGEIRLGNILEQIFSPDQYMSNVVIKKGSNEKVDYAIKLPGREKNKEVLLPIDSKFPNEIYHKLIDAYEKSDQDLIEESLKQLETRIKLEAKNIKEKYIDPPTTTDFAIMFLPTEGLYAEVLRINGLFETLQREYNVIPTGPTNLVAFLNSLQMGFRTLAIEKRSNEVRQLLTTFRTEFNKFSELLDKVYKKLQETMHAIEDATKRSRTIEQKLRRVEQLPVSESEKNFYSENILELENVEEKDNG
jgi:DNA recombination protein RmuC